MNRIPRWRIAAALLIVAALALIAAKVGPIYVRNLELQNFVNDLSRQSGTPSQTDDLLRSQVIQKAQGLGLPVKADNVRIVRAADNVRFDVRYVVRVDMPGYTVNLHFYPGAGSR